MTTLLRSERRGRALWLTLDDPARANALSATLVANLTAELSGPARDPGVRAVVVTGAGRVFSAGADLEALAAMADRSHEENLADAQRLAAMFRALLEVPALTVAMVNGPAIAGGCGLANACDLTLASPTATFMYSEVRIGFVPGIVAGILASRLPGHVVRELLLLPRPLTAAEAMARGLVHSVHPPDALVPAVERLIEEAATTTSGTAVAATKRLLAEIPGRSLAEALNLGAKANAEARSTADCRLGVANFLAKKSFTW